MDQTFGRYTWAHILRPKVSSAGNKILNTASFLYVLHRNLIQVHLIFQNYTLIKTFIYNIITTTYSTEIYTFSDSYIIYFHAN